MITSIGAAVIYLFIPGEKKYYRVSLAASTSAQLVPLVYCPIAVLRVEMVLFNAITEVIPCSREEADQDESSNAKTDA